MVGGADHLPKDQINPPHRGARDRFRWAVMTYESRPTAPTGPGVGPLVGAIDPSGTRSPVGFRIQQAELSGSGREAMIIGEVSVRNRREGNIKEGG